MRRAVVFIVGLAAAVAIVLVIVPAPRPPLPPLDPPDPPTAGLEPAVAARIRERRAAVLAQPDSADAWGRLGIVFDVHDLFGPALACYTRAGLLDPGAFRWPYLLGRVSLVGDQRAGIAAFERALAIRDDYPTLYERLGSGYLALDELDRAEASFARAAELDPGLARAHLGLGRVALQRDDAAGALAHLETAVEHGASSGELEALLAEANRRLGKPAAAARHLARAAEGVKFEPLPDPVHSELAWEEGVSLRWHEVRGEQHRRSGRLDLAIAEWEAAARGNPDSVRAHSNLGLLYSQAGRPGDAIREFTRVVELDPNATDARLDIAMLRIRQGRVDEGLTILRDFCRDHPKDDDARVRLIRALRGAGRVSEADDALRDAMRDHPGSSAVHFEEGLVAANVGRLGDAAELFAQAAALDATNVAAHRNAARALARMRRFREALAALRRGLAAVPDDPRLTNALAWMLATCPDDDLRDGVEAVRLAEDLCRRTSRRDPVPLDTLAAALAEVGDFDAAVRTLESALALARAAGDDAVARRLEPRLPTYRNRTPHRDVNLNE